MKRKFLIALCLVSLLSGCGGHLRLKSSPEKSVVELVRNDGQGLTQLGETPFTISSGDLSDKQSSGPYILRISKDGFAPRELVIATLAGLEMDLNLELKPYPLADRTNELISKLFFAQNFAQKSDYSASLTALDEIQKRFPDIAAVYEMRGSIYMIQGRYIQAQAELAKALALDPNNEQLRALHEAALRSSKGKSAGGESR